MHCYNTSLNSPKSLRDGPYFMPGETKAQLNWNIWPLFFIWAVRIQGWACLTHLGFLRYLENQTEDIPHCPAAWVRRAKTSLDFFSPIVNLPFLATVQSFPGTVWNCTKALQLASACVCSQTGFPLFDLKLSWAMVFHGSIATQTGQRKVGSLLHINTTSHMSFQTAKSMWAEPSISLACINFQRTGGTVHPLYSDEFAFLGLLILGPCFPIGQAPQPQIP